MGCPGGGHHRRLDGDGGRIIDIGRLPLLLSGWWCCVIDGGGVGRLGRGHCCCLGGGGGCVINVGGVI